ncbi:MAG TPA: hypothetical protein VFM14_08345 [Gemmatimonadales bacterium]|nr:hypothetical protein [Gemmatimonadales bacterium]
MTGPESIEPPARLEARVLGTLRAQGLLGDVAPRRRYAIAPRWRWPLAIAAGLLLFVGGMAVGRRPAPGPAQGLRQYTLLLYEGPEFNAGGVSEPALVREYSGWAASLAGKNRLVAGEKLDPKAWTLGAGSPAPAGPTGFFVIAAAGDDEALAIARTCPHLRHGGTVLVRPIDRT